MKAEQIIADLAASGVTLRAERGTLYAAPMARLTVEMAEAVAANKRALLAWLREEPERRAEWEAKAAAIAERAWRDDPFGPGAGARQPSVLVTFGGFGVAAFSADEVEALGRESAEWARLKTKGGTGG